jgi:hypothetical protein
MAFLTLHLGGFLLADITFAKWPSVLGRHVRDVRFRPLVERKA